MGVADPSAASNRRRGLDRQRQLTIMFVDVIGSTPLAETLEAERWRDILLTFHDICDQAISRYGGTVSTRMGDGIMAHFGLDELQEDDARRAVLAGLAIQRGVVPLTTAVKNEDDEDFQVRVGVHSGPALITEIGHHNDIVGTTPNETARIESAALPGTVALSDATRRLLGDEFEFDEPRLVELKGVSSPMLLYTVLGTSEARRSPPTTPVVGRSEERQELANLWTAVVNGRASPSAALIMGEAGIGKTRLAEYVNGVGRLDGARRLWLETRSFDSAVPLHPVSAALDTSFRLYETEDANERYRRLEEGLRELGDAPSASLFGRLLGMSSGTPDDATDPSLIREQLLQAARAWIASVSAGKPTVVVVEDLHWADDDTLSLLESLITDPLPHVLLLMTARPDFDNPWSIDDVLTIELGPLGVEDVAKLAEFSLDGSTPTDEELEALQQASDGNPLYVDRLLSTLGIGALISGTEVPDGLDHLITTIIEAPGVDRQLVGLLATIGRRLDVAFVSEIVGVPSIELVGQLDALCEHGILERVDTQGRRPAFYFHHAMVQSAAYEHQLPSDRRLAHASIADAIERSPGVVELDNRSIARHLDLAGRAADAVPVYLAASKAAPRRGAVLEASQLAQRGIELLSELPDDARSEELESKLQLQLAFTHTSQKGYSSVAAVESAERARQLSDPRVGGKESSRAIRALVTLCTNYMTRGQREKSAEVLSEIRDLVGSTQHEHVADQLEALHIWHLGQYRESSNLYHKVIEHLEDEERAGRLRLTAMPGDHLASAYIQMGPISYHLGNGDEALASIDRALDRGRAVGGVKGAFTEGWANSWLIYLQINFGDFEAAAQTAEETVASSARHGLDMWEIMARAYQWLARGLMAPSDEQITALATYISACERAGALTMTPYFMMQRARLLHAVGRPAEAIDGFADAIETAERTQEVPELAEAYRLRALVHGSVGELGAANSDLLQAVSIATEQNAVILRLRALCDRLELSDTAGQLESTVDELQRVISTVRSPDRFSEVARGRQLVASAAVAKS